MSAPNNAVNLDLSKYPEQALIREADGLTVDEKVLLFTIASHKNGASFATVETLRQWTGLSRNRYYRARTSLVAKRLVTEERSRGGATTYRLRKGELRAAAQGGILRRRLAKAYRASVATSMPPEPLPVMGTPPAVSGDESRTRVGDDSLADIRHAKRNDEPNVEDIKNMKPRRVRPPQRVRPAKEAQIATRQADLRARINEHREKWSTP